MVQTIGILSIGEMGLGVAQLLRFHGYRVVTNVSDRSQATQARAKAHNIESLPSDDALVQQSAFILSIVPPRDALSTARRIHAAAARLASKPAHLVDLNAVSPTTSKHTLALLDRNPHVLLYDGVISGGVPHPTARDAAGAPTAWHCPTLLMSGPRRLAHADAALAHALSVDHMSDAVGAAVAVKMCFGMTTKGFTALAIQAFTTAHRLGVRAELEAFLARYKPAHLRIAEEGLVRMPHTAYRWVHEMLEMADTAAEYGGFGRELFQGVADSYRLVAEDTVLGSEVADARVRGQTVLDAVTCISEGVDRKQHAAAAPK